MCRTLLSFLFIVALGDQLLAQTPIIEPEAFDKMVTQDVTYAITGERVPTGGVKVDLTKASGTVTGYLATSKVDFSLDVGIGVTEGSAALFSSYKNLHSDFNVALNVIYIPHRSSSSMDDGMANLVRQSRTVYRTFIEQTRRDSLYCLALIARWHGVQGIDQRNAPVAFTLQQLPLSGRDQSAAVAGIIAQVSSFTMASDTSNLTTTQQGLIREYAKKYYQVRVNQLLAIPALLSAASGRDDLLIRDLMAAAAKFDKIDSDYIEYQINLTNGRWNVKRLFWVVGSPFVKRQAFSLFDQSVLSRKDTSSLTYGAGISAHWLWDYRKSLLYWKVGLDLFRGSNLSDFKKVQYIQQDSITSATSKYVYSETRGISYTNAVLDHGFGYRFSAEFFVFFSKKNFVPGISARYEYFRSTVLEKDWASSVELGMLFNVNSPDKKKSVISIAPYVRFENLNAPDDPEIENEIERDDFLVGLRIGLPINILSN